MDERASELSWIAQRSAVAEKKTQWQKPSLLAFLREYLSKDLNQKTPWPSSITMLSVSLPERRWRSGWGFRFVLQLLTQLNGKVCYWHTFRGNGGGVYTVGLYWRVDMFGEGTIQRPWDDGSNSLENAKRRLRVAFEFFQRYAAFFSIHKICLAWGWNTTLFMTETLHQKGKT